MKYNLILLQHEQTKGMKSFGPKALLRIKLHNRLDLVINHQLEQVAPQSGAESKIIMVVGFDKDRLQKKIDFNKKYKQIVFVENTNYKIYNQSYAMMMGLKQIDNDLPTVVIDSGVLLQHPFVLDNKLCLDNNLVFTNKNTKEFDIGCTINNDSIEYMFYDLNPRWVNMLSISPKYIHKIIEIAEKHRNANIFEVINYSLKSCNTKFMAIDSKVYYIKNQKHRLVK